MGGAREGPSDRLCVCLCACRDPADALLDRIIRLELASAELRGQLKQHIVDNSLL